MNSRYSKKKIRRPDRLAAGSLSEAEKLEALQIGGHWRAAHMEPLHKTLSMLEEVCNRDKSTILVSRLKRIDTIINKLSRPGYSSFSPTLEEMSPAVDSLLKRMTKLGE